MRLLAITLALVILAVGGCGDDDDSDNSGGQGPTAADSSTTTVDDGESGDNDGTATDENEPSRAEFIRDADRVCTDARKDLGSAGADLEPLVRQLQKGEINEEEYYQRAGEITADFAARASRAIDEIEALPRPSTGQDTLDAYLEATRTQVRLLEEQADALRDADLQASAELNTELAKARTATQKAARQFGFHSCGGG